MSVDTVTITDNEQVEALLPTHIRRQGVGVLVDLVWIAGLVTA